MLVTFLDWQFEVNKPLTAQTYAQIDNGAAERCGCGSCLAYAARRSSVFPPEVLDFLEQTGIDFAKEVGLYEAARFEDVIIYGAWFHFAGRILNDTTDKIYLDEKGRKTCAMFKVRPLFDMGFWEDKRGAYFADEHIDLVQMEFVIMLTMDKMPDCHEAGNIILS